MSSSKTKLELPPFFGPSQAARWFSAWNALREEPLLEIVVPRDAFPQPAGLVLLCAGIADRQERGLESVFSGDAPFVPLERVRDHDVARRLADAATERLSTQHPGLSRSLLRTARILVEELGANIVDHSGRSSTGFGAAQFFPQENRLQIAFADAGRGFLATMQRNPELLGRIEDEGVAIQLALEKGLSGGQPAMNIGWGLALLRSFADQFGADLWIASGGSMLQRRTVSGARVNSLTNVTPWNGAWICLESRLPVSSTG